MIQIRRSSGSATNQQGLPSCVHSRRCIAPDDTGDYDSLGLSERDTSDVAHDLDAVDLRTPLTRQSHQNVINGGAGARRRLAASSPPRTDRRVRTGVRTLRPADASLTQVIETPHLNGTVVVP
jgi:hypothetical protein